MRTFKVKNKTKKDGSPDKMTVIYIFHAYKRTKNTPNISKAMIEISCVHSNI